MKWLCKILDGIRGPYSLLICWLILTGIYWAVGYRWVVNGGFSENDANVLWWCCFSFWAMVSWAVHLHEDY